MSKCLTIYPPTSKRRLVEGCPQIATCGVTLQGCTSARKQIRNLPLHSGHGSVQPYYRIINAANDHHFGRSIFSLGCSQVSDWAVDYSVSGGTDKEGWQYAADFPAYVSSLISLIHVVPLFYCFSVFTFLSFTCLSLQVISRL